MADTYEVTATSRMDMVKHFLIPCALYSATIAAIRQVYLANPNFDLSILNRVHSHATPTFTRAARTLSFVGSPDTLWPTVALIAVILWLRHLRHQAVFLAAVVLASGALESLIKLAVHRPRPAVPWAYVHEYSYSFPSGHATLAAALYGTTIWLTRRLPVAQRVAVAAPSLLMIVAIGLSRLYLGAHNPTDVLAGYLTGSVALLLAAAFNRRLSPAPFSAKL